MGDNLNKSINEIFLGINELAYSTGEWEEYIDTFESGSSLEQEKAQEYYDQIQEDTAPEALRNLFEGFETKTSTPNKESESLATGKTSRVSSLVKSFETLHASSEIKPKKESGKQTGIKRKIITRAAAKEGESSPLKVLEPKKRKIVTASKKLQFGNMANADIPNAKRLNPRRKKRGGETLANLGYQKLSREDISNSGKIV